MIKPTVGRILWYWKAESDGATVQRDQPLAAIVTYVHGDRMVNIAFWDANGAWNSATSVPLIQAGDSDRMKKWGCYCEWMPYQTAQAAKAEALEKELGK